MPTVKPLRANCSVAVTRPAVGSAVKVNIPVELLALAARCVAELGFAHALDYVPQLLSAGTAPLDAAQACSNSRTHGPVSLPSSLKVLDWADS